MLRNALAVGMVGVTIAACADPSADVDDTQAAEADLSVALGCEGPDLQVADVLGRLDGDTTVRFGTYAIEGRQRFCPVNQPCKPWTRTAEHVRGGRLAGYTTLHPLPNNSAEISFDGNRAPSATADDGPVGVVPIGTALDPAIMGTFLKDTEHTTFSATTVRKSCFAMTAKRSETWSSGTSEWEYTLKADNAPATRAPIASYFKQQRKVELRCSSYNKYLQYTCTGEIEFDLDTFGTMATVIVSPDGRSLRLLDGPGDIGQREIPLAADGKGHLDIASPADTERSVAVDATGKYLNLWTDFSTRSAYSSQCGPYGPSGYATKRELRCTGTLVAP